MIFNINANHQAYVLTKTAALFSRFGVTIEDWQMSADKQKPTMSQRIHVHCEAETAKRIQKQLQRMVDVFDVDLSDAKDVGVHEWHVPTEPYQQRQQTVAAK